MWNAGNEDYFASSVSSSSFFSLSTSLSESLVIKVADSIFASGYLTEGGQSLEETFRTIEAAGFTWQVESA